MLKKISLGLLCAFMGAVFIFSGYSKLYPIEPFEYTFVDLGFINWQIAPFIARFLIGLEFLIGALLILNLSLRKIAYKLGSAVLLLFCIYLILLIFFTGNKGNCGCFGTSIQMTPLQALIKNIIMLAVFFVLNRYYDGKFSKSLTKGLIIEVALLIPFLLVIWGLFLLFNWQPPNSLIPIFAFSFISRAIFLIIVILLYLKRKDKSKLTEEVLGDKNIPLQHTTQHTPSQEGNKKNRLLNYLILFVFVLSFAMPFILNTVELNYSEAYLNKPEENFKIELDSLYNHATLNAPPKTLSEGKHIIAFMSLTCPHCRIAANKIRIIHERNPSIPFYFVLNGDTEKLKPFFENTHTENIPHCILLGRSFVYLAGTNMPAIYMVNNSIVEHQVNYMDLDQGEVEKWLHLSP